MHLELCLFSFCMAQARLEIGSFNPNKPSLRSSSFIRGQNLELELLKKREKRDYKQAGS